MSLARRPCRIPSVLPSLVALLAAVVLGRFATPLRAQTSPVDFDREVRPLLSDRCFACHGPDAGHRQAELRLDLDDGLTERRIVVPRDRPASALWERITSDDPSLRMPPPDSGKELRPDEIERLGRWIDQGGEIESHWAYAPLREPDPAEFAPGDPQRDPIDRRLEFRLAQRGLQAAGPADEATLLRRVTLDLVGLPPDPDDVRAYFEDPDPNRYGRWVERLLDSTAYGERMAIFWFDLVRFADTVGYHGDQEHHIAPYRDWVIDALARDMPFDRFSSEQLAGDLRADAAGTATDDDGPRIATGYLRVLQTSHEGGIQRGEYLAKYSADRVRNFGEVWLGATLGCAECHDHKFDPFTQRDFYSLAAFFADLDDVSSFAGTDTSPTRREPELEVRSPLDRRRTERLDEAIARTSSALEALGSDPQATDEREALRGEIDALQQERARLDERRFRTMVAKSVEPRTIRILSRGDWMDESGAVVEPAVPASLPALVRDRGARLGRQDLADWLFGPAEPIVARVLANRLWARLMGRGIAADLTDFGAQGSPPSDPELLDHLARSLIDGGWRLKPFVRRIVLTETYRRTALGNAALRHADPENELFGRQRRIRLEAEIIRDQALAASGLLVDEPGGDACRPYQPDGYYASLNFPLRTYEADRGKEQYRRGVYVHRQRQFLHPMFRAFDAPSREECTARRSVSNTPVGALAALNDPSLVEAARVAAERQVLRDDWRPSDPRSVRDAIDRLFRSVLVREADEVELRTLVELHRSIRDDYRADPAAAAELLKVGAMPASSSADPIETAALTFVMRAILNTDESLMRP
ncbi:MAG TPA: PSD1 and planctomycete cytochrome C domain-containing protein [Pirellulaceae bacterium]|nr:PSD1 and planctomycete cytochrome C domain-containing protein [Pirellulaceae bacterium]